MRADPRSFPALNPLDPNGSPVSRIGQDGQGIIDVNDPGLVITNSGLADSSVPMAMDWAIPGGDSSNAAEGDSKQLAGQRSNSPSREQTPTPPKKRTLPPTSIPNFSSSSSASPSIFQVPATPPSRPPQSPWHQLALASGAPTPSLESGPGRQSAGSRNSPALGYPFERLNIGGSWSGANLFGAGQGDQPAGDGFSLPPPEPLSAPAPLQSPSMTSTSGTSGMSAQTIARYRALAGKSETPDASASAGINSPTQAATAAMPPPPVPAGAPPAFQLKLPGSSLANRRMTLPKTDAKGSAQTQQNFPSASSPPRVSFPSPAPQAGPSTKNRLQPLAPGDAKALLAKESSLLLDIRPPSSFHPCHVPNSHSLPIPSTLLRRQTFSLQKLAMMLPQPAVGAITRYREMADIILIDQESHDAPDGSVLKGLSMKFYKEDFKGQIWFVKGGIAALIHRREIEMEHGEDTEEEEQSSNGAINGPLAPSTAPSSLSAARLMAGRLGKLAFQQGSTGSSRNGVATPGARSLTLPTPSRPFSAHSDIVPNGSTSNGSNAATERPLFTSRRDIDMAPRSPLSPSGSNRSRKLQPANPFFDNIRQNLELSHGGITERIPLALPDHIVKRAKDLPHWLRDLVEAPEDVSMQKLAMEFYSIELGEQKRLQGVMDWHSHGSGGIMDSHYGGQAMEGLDSAKRGALVARFKQEMELKRLTPKGSTGEEKEEGYFPFSITAGVERGTKNRYKNIWPYDFSRVRLASPADDDSDYINASFVQPRTTARRYIATQGPLDSTYRDFWTLVWEQNVTVIVMLTKQFEGGLLKCGDYWSEGTYGALRLEQISVTGVEEDKPDASDTTGFDFGYQPEKALKPQSTGDKGNIKRTFMLRHMDQPSRPPRKVVQIQCITWPDFDVPESPECLLRLIRDVDETVDEIHGTGSRSDQSRTNLPPVLVHCSAGVGRTGSFIVVDAIIDALRRERQTVEKEKRNVRSLRNRSSSKLLAHTSRFGSETSSTSAGSSFLNPFSADQSGSALVTSPGAIASSPGSQAGNNALSPKPESMDVDAQGAIPIPAAAAPKVSEGAASQFTEFREGRRDSIDSNGPGFVAELKRPSLNSAGSNDSNATGGSLPAENDILQGPLPLSNSHGVARQPSPINEMDDPIQTVLEGMRVQRMSLCQSLRQYLFVYRVIIYYYLQLLDQEAAENEANVTSDSEIHTGGLSSIMSLSTAASSAVSTDDEGHQKRRASPTELQAGSNLSKRPSFKKMRPAGTVNVLSPPESGSPGGSPGRLRKSQD